MPVDLEIRARRSKSLLENEWFVETMRNLREHAILRALNAIEVSLKADVDAMEILKHKGKHRG